MLEWFLLVLGILFLILSAVGAIPFSTSKKSIVREAIRMAFFTFGILHIIVAVYISVSPVPFGALINQTQNYTYNYSQVNTTNWIYNSTLSLVQTEYIGNLRLDNKTISIIPTYNVYGVELVSFLAYVYMLLGFFILVLFALRLWAFATNKVPHVDDSEVEDA